MFGKSGVNIPGGLYIVKVLKSYVELTRTQIKILFNLLIQLTDQRSIHCQKQRETMLEKKRSQLKTLERLTLKLPKGKTQLDSSNCLST